MCPWIPRRLRYGALFHLAGPGVRIGRDLYRVDSAVDKRQQRGWFSVMIEFRRDQPWAAGPTQPVAIAWPATYLRGQRIEEHFAIVGIALEDNQRSATPLDQLKGPVRPGAP